MNTAWPVTALFVSAFIAAAALLIVLAYHLGPHPDDIERIRAHLALKSLGVRSIRRSRAVWRHHYHEGGWRLSRFARFYRVEATTAVGSASEMLAAFDPWKPNEGIRII